MPRVADHVEGVNQGVLVVRQGKGRSWPQRSGGRCSPSSSEWHSMHHPRPTSTLYVERCETTEERGDNEWVMAHEFRKYERYDGIMGEGRSGRSIYTVVHLAGRKISTNGGTVDIRGSAPVK